MTLDGVYVLQYNVGGKVELMHLNRSENQKAISTPKKKKCDFIYETIHMSRLH